MTVMKVNAHEISDESGLVGRFVGLKTKADNEVVDEAVRMAYVSGQKHTILANFAGVFKSMIDGAKRDANIRKIDDYLSLTPWAKCRVDDVCEAPAHDDVKVILRARPLKEMKLNVSGWTILVEGAEGTITIDTISTGEVANEVVAGEAIVFTGANFSAPSEILWEVPEMGTKGSFDLGAVMYDATTINAPGLMIDGADGKVVKFTLRMNGKKALKTALYRAAA